MNIEFVRPSFNEFTLNFPLPTEAEIARAKTVATLDGVHGAVASVFLQAAANARRARRNQKRLTDSSTLFWGSGYTFITPDSPPFDMDHIQNSTRAERRRKQFGRDKAPVTQAVVECWGQDATGYSS
jgi:hypothetical protein